MTRNEKKTAIENMAERFMNISDLEGKSIEELEEISENSICQSKDKRRGKKESGVALYDIKGLHSGYCRFTHIKSTGCD